MNAPAHAALGSPEAVELLFDREDRRIGIRAVDPSTEHAYLVRPLGRSSSWLVSGRAFTVYYGIPTEVAHRWVARMDEGMLIVDLKEPGAEVTGHRTSERAMEATG